MRATVGLLLLALVGCYPEPSQYVYRVNEIQVLMPDGIERWSYFYGEPQALRLENQTLRLEQGPAQGTWAVPNALLVNGQPLWREASSAVQPVARTSRMFGGLQYAVRTSKPVARVWLYDSGWLGLGNGFAANDSRLVEGSLEAPSFSHFSSAETQVVLNEILARRAGRTVVVYELEPPLPFNRYEPSPSAYNRVALAVQYGVDSEIVMQTPQQPPKPLFQTGNSAYLQPTPAAYLAITQPQLETVWRLATGNQSPAPALPVLNFGQSRVAAFFWGQKNTGGYRIQFVSSSVERNTLRVVLQLSSPTPGGFTTQALTSPALLLEVARSIVRVEFMDTEGRLLASANAGN